MRTISRNLCLISLNQTVIYQSLHVVLNVIIGSASKQLHQDYFEIPETLQSSLFMVRMPSDLSQTQLLAVRRKFELNTFPQPGVLSTCAASSALHCLRLSVSQFLKFHIKFIVHNTSPGFQAFIKLKDTTALQSLSDLLSQPLVRPMAHLFIENIYLCSCESAVFKK